jgi:hypothetical protein|tara:strand:+ start:8867 stop:9562 length:696 start_codon:yes stop_codon:yes gene_type:complete
MGLFDQFTGGGTNQVGAALQTFQTIIIAAIVGVVIFGALGIFLLKRNDNKKYNIPLIIITPRSDGKVVEINRGLGGFFKSARVGGITSFRVKRPGIKITEMPPPSSDFLSSPNRTLVLAQKGIDDYEPILPESLARVKIHDGRIVPILKLKAINQEATAWGFDNAESAKRRFTFSSLWDKYQTMITMMTFVFILFIIMYINWIGMKDVVTGLASVAESLRGTATPIITPGG